MHRFRSGFLAIVTLPYSRRPRRDGRAAGAVKERVNDVSFELPPTPVAAGSKLRLKLSYTTSPAGAPSSSARMLYGGRYRDSGITVTTGTLQ